MRSSLGRKTGERGGCGGRGQRRGGGGGSGGQRAESGCPPRLLRHVLLRLSSTLGLQEGLLMEKRGKNVTFMKPGFKLDGRGVQTPPESGLFTHLRQWGGGRGGGRGRGRGNAGEKGGVGGVEEGRELSGAFLLNSLTFEGVGDAAQVRYFSVCS